MAGEKLMMVLLAAAAPTEPPAAGPAPAPAPAEAAAHRAAACQSLQESRAALAKLLASDAFKTMGAQEQADLRGPLDARIADAMAGGNPCA
ncbi:hypothetical protein [Sphingomonas morindae]|uniref:Secreted protein n=1 Tax=Sphingomonas morindae TaxID=1541170 RepID=A0ABY4X7Y2_9SPHN|nr:hypothetical protein [Sphingomonas morindae]USI72755.1 hypothetical protein LHA26_16010 [Sphingomonas morindae]